MINIIYAFLGTPLLGFGIFYLVASLNDILDGIGRMHTARVQKGVVVSILSSIAVFVGIMLIRSAL
jgi:hypothetical protein